MSLVKIYIYSGIAISDQLYMDTFSFNLFSLTRVNSTSCEMISERPNEDYSLDKDIDFTFSILEVKLETTLMSPD